MFELKTKHSQTRKAPTSPPSHAPDVLPETLNGIGKIERGSLEEAIWAELGALPPSRANGTISLLSRMLQAKPVARCRKAK